jgi:hypothetical protein
MTTWAPWEQGSAAAKQAIAQFKSEQPSTTICPSCRGLISVTYDPAPADSFVTKCECSASNRIFRGILGPPDWILAVKQQYVQKAAHLGVLDATFFATYFNESKQGNYFECPIDPRALSPDASEAAIADAIACSRRLHHGPNAYVGSAFHNYPDENLTFEEAVKKLKRDNPGFCEAAYEAVINDNIRGMR